MSGLNGVVEPQPSSIRVAHEWSRSLFNFGLRQMLEDIVVCADELS